jgi:Mrp family chromosome partitioning ATPase
MIVGKAINMASMMNIPVLGLVENYSYLECPDCKKKINVFGESKVDKVASEYGIDTTAKIPIDPNFASLSDKGTIELLDSNYLDNIFDKIEKIGK